MTASGNVPSREDFARLIQLKREKNPFLKTEFIRKHMATHGFTAEDIGTTEAELQAFDVQDCRWQIVQDLENWRLTNGIGHPERCFAEGVVEALEKGELQPEEFGISAQELEDIRKTAGLA